MSSRSREASQVSLRASRRAALAGVFSLACAPDSPKTPAPAAPPPRYTGRLEDYVPAAGLRWLVRGFPAKLAESQSFRPALDLIITPARLQAVAKTTGFALETLPKGLMAGFDLGTMYLAELPGAAAELARARFAARQILPVSERRPEPGIVVMLGTSEGQPIGLLTIDERVVIYAAGDPLLWKVAEGYARDKLHAKRAFQGAGLAHQDAETDGALCAAHVPGPFDERWQNAAGGLLSITTSVSARLDPNGPERGVLELSLHGDFADSDAAERLLSAYMSVAGSSTGSLLGLSGALEARATLSASNDRVTLRVPMPLTEIAKGMRAATSADLAEAFGLSSRMSSPLPPTSPPDAR